MNKITGALIAALTLLPLSACDKGKGDDRLAGRVEDAADNRADAMENNADMMRNQADMLDNRAGAVRDNGEARGDAIDAADVNANAMTPEQRQAIIANQAPAVR